MAPHGDPPEKELDRVLTPAEKASIHHGESVDALPNPQEKRALRKFDMILLPQIALLILVAFLDRSNIGNAKVFGLEGPCRPCLIQCLLAWMDTDTRDRGTGSPRKTVQQHLHHVLSLLHPLRCAVGGLHQTLRSPPCPGDGHGGLHVRHHRRMYPFQGKKRALTGVDGLYSNVCSSDGLPTGPGSL